MAMKAFYTLVFFMVAAFGFATVKSWMDARASSNPVATTASTANYALPQVSQQQYVRRDMPDGAVMYQVARPEALPENLQDIAPAAGGQMGRVKYDALTQTYRREVVDSEGNTRQEIIQAPAKR